ncbi:coiled-coil domain-containing protein 191 [Lampris incognitus]|uniref:coiled-coil domain-containing protein 191 n=1 Tax=Lampris incognitus TaxID=2546036 RepID=UPI0024B4D9BF|nr:coiled-coil domain-containing protein 191 [Lampris incognitus]
MAYSGHNPPLFSWRRVTSSETPAHKMQLKNDDIDQWMKKVEMASAYAVSEVLAPRKRSRTKSHAMALQSTDQLQDHDEAYSEAQALLSDWMTSKLHLELELGEEGNLIGSNEMSRPDAMGAAQPAALDFSNFDDLYNHLAEEEENNTVTTILQDLMEREVLDCRAVKDLALDWEQTVKKMKDPTITMDERHKQVRENRARREAERQRQQREKVAQREAKEEANRRERQEEAKKRQEGRRQEEMVQQEMVKLRRQMAERRCVEQLVRQREKERMDKQVANRSLQSASLLPTKQLQDKETALQLYKEQEVQARIYILNLKCMQRHFSGWYSVLLEKRIRLGKAAALCDWRRKLRAWRAWRALVWSARKQRETERTEEELRDDNRGCQLATESDRRRLLRRCLSDWQLWCRVEREQRELLARKAETRRKMAALINSASTGKLKATETKAYSAIMASPETPDQPETTDVERSTLKNPTIISKDAQAGFYLLPMFDNASLSGLLSVSLLENHQKSGAQAPAAASLPNPDKTSAGAAAKLLSCARPTQPWQVSRRHAGLTAGELHRAQRRAAEGEDGGGAGGHNASRAGRFEHRHAAQQRTIQQQRKLLRDQHEGLEQLQEEHRAMGLKLEVQRAVQRSNSAASGQRGCNLDSKGQRSVREGGDTSNSYSAPTTADARKPCPHPIITAMEERARQRAERRRELEELKRKKEEEKLAHMKAAVEERQREEEEEKRQAAERRMEERRQAREREQEKQRQCMRLQELRRLAQQHYHRSLLLRRGFAPWKCLLHLKQTNMQLAENHCNLHLLRRFTLAWQQHAGESLSHKQALADQLHRHALLCRGMESWKRLRDWQRILEERARHFYRTHTLRRFLLALADHVSMERLVQWDRQALAQDYSDRRVLRSCLLAWRRFPRLQREEREREARRERLRRKVAEVLPDFCRSPLESLREPSSL